MPRVPQDIIDSVFYLYKNKEDAEQGNCPGGTGFIIACPLNDDVIPVAWAYYGITNWHVACRDGFSVVRINTISGGTDILEFGPEDWNFIARGPDLAVVPLNLNRDIYTRSCVRSHLFISKSELREIGVGDDVFMLGLFVDHGGTTTNIPKARFGNVSMLPSSGATIEQPTKYDGESFILDMHSRAGYSGSPVFIYRTPLGDLSGSFPSIRGTVNVREIQNQFSRGSTAHEVDVEIRLRTSVFKLLGVHWAQFPEQWEIQNPELLSESDKSQLEPISKLLKQYA